ncbi:MAG TPA: hypothetical protein VI233_07770, partial [Puia sp.]
MKYILYLLSFLTLHLSTNAQQQFISGGEKDLQGMLDAQGTVLFSSKHTAAPPAKDLHINHVLTLEINPALTPDLAKNFSVSIHIIASFVNTSGSPEQEEKDLQVTYTAKGQYRAKDAFEKEGADIVDYKLTAVSVKDGNGAPIGITPANKNMVLLKQHLQFDRYPEPNPLGAIGSQDITVSNDKGYARLSWAQVPWALAYDVEYSYTDNYTLQTGNFNTPANTGYNFRFNSTRVQVKNAAYEIPLVYENGYLVFRVRPVGLWGSRFDKVVTGRWSISADEGNSLTGEQVGAEGHFFCTIEKKAVHEDDSKNWQYMALFAEEGKRKDNVTYLDGTLRNRQSIINLNTQQNLLVNETIYDNLGRPAISVLPTPLIPAGFPNTHTPRIEYQVALNQNMAGKPYSWKDFDIDRNCTLFPDKFNPSSSGAARYYSPNNPFIDASGSGVKRQMAFVADAAGYPFIQKEYTPDNSGRIKRLSAPGTTFSFGPDPSTTHEQRYFYGTPSQEELDRVFGNDIGFASHYSKEIKIDENYQASVTYKNLKGNIVATALAGLPPKSLTPLSEPVNRKKIRVNIIDERNYTENNSIIATFPLVMTETDSLDLAYGVTQKGLPFSICKQPTKLCYDCVYDLGLKITDACGKELYDIKETIGTLDRLRECESDPIKFTRNKTIKLSPGSYFISKTLTVNENAIAAYIDNYLNDPCWTNQIQLPPPVDCTPVKCNIITIEKGDDCDTNSLTGITRPKIRHLPQPQPVDADCTPSIGKDIGSISIQKMLADLSPGGQYAQYPTAGDPLSSVYNYPLSVLNTNNQLPSRGNWKNPVYAYRNKNGMEIFIEKVVNGVVKRLAPQDLTLDEFLQNWDPGMAYSLLPYHPEYCYYEWGAEHKNYFDYEDKMKATEKFPSNPAEFGPLLKAPYLLPDTLKDPLFIENKTLIPQMIKYMTDMAALQPGLGTVKMVDLASISAAGFSGDVTPVQAMSYIANHNPLLFNDPDLKDEEWTKFKFYYLMARTKIIEELRAKKIINNQRPSCCMQNEYIGNITCQGLPNNGFCALFAAKTPVYPTQGRIQTIINTGTSLPVPSSGTDINCLNCAQPQSYVLFLNTLQAKNQLFANRRITGSQLGMIANTGSDAIIAKGDHIKWVSVRTVNRLDAKLIHEEDASVLCTITLSSADSLFDWDKMVNFSCLKSAGAAGDFRLTAWDAQTAPFILNGNSSCFFTKECAPPTEFTTSCVNREYTPLFVEMLEKALISVSAGNIPSEIITGRRPASNAYPAGKDPVNLWHITGNTPIGNNFDIPLNFSTSSNIPASKISIRSTNNLFASFADWRITGYELVPQPRQTEHCDEINTIKIKVQKRLQPQVSDFF